MPSCLIYGLLGVEPEAFYTLGKWSIYQSTSAFQHFNVQEVRVRFEDAALTSFYCGLRPFTVTTSHKALRKVGHLDSRAFRSTRDNPVLSLPVITEPPPVGCPEHPLCWAEHLGQACRYLRLRTGGFVPSQHEAVSEDTVHHGGDGTAAGARDSCRPHGIHG